MEASRILDKVASRWRCDRWIVFSEDDGRWIAKGANVRRASRIYFANALKTTRSTYKPINSRTYFTGGLP